MSSRRELVGASGNPGNLFKCLCESDVESLRSSEEFATLDAKLAASFSKIHNGDLASQIIFLEETLI